jgi:phenylacetate-CoA ligase
MAQGSLIARESARAKRASVSPAASERYLVPAVEAETIPGLVWPALPEREDAGVLALRFQLERSQWWPESRLRAAQLRQLKLLLDHAVATVPFYRETLPHAGYEPGRPLTEEIWSSLPVIRREHIVAAGSHIHSEQIPAAHGATASTSTSGSTGAPLLTLKTALDRHFHEAGALLELLWHRRDLSRKSGVIRSSWSGGRRVSGASSRDSYGRPFSSLFRTGKVVQFNVHAPPSEQVEWLIREAPDYLLSLPSNLRALAQYSLDNRIKLPPLKEVRSYGEAFDADFPKLCREVWGAKHTSIYSTNEVGMIASQCPKRPHFHVHAELVRVEVLDDQGRPCRPGEAGRVILSPLHNFAMPLVRYEIADMAEVGEPCPCGRGLPVLKRVLGRRRALLTLPSGTRKYVGSVAGICAEFPQVLQRQLVQKTVHDIDVLLVSEPRLSDAEERRLLASLPRKFGDWFRFRLIYVPDIPRNREGKYEDFRSEIPYT